MSTDEAVRRPFERHEAYAGGGTDGEYVVETTTFDSRVTATTDAQTVYTLTVRTPSLDSAVEEAVGPHLREGWFETLERRVEDASSAVRTEIDLEVAVESTDGMAIVTLRFPFDRPERAPDVAKAMAEYVEGSYLQGTVPGFTYRPPVSELLANATDGDDRSQGPLPL